MAGIGETMEVNMSSAQSVHSTSSLEIEVERSVEQELYETRAELDRTRVRLEKMRKYAAKLKSQLKVYKQQEGDPALFQSPMDSQKENERLCDENAKLTSEVHFLRAQLALFMAERDELKGKLDAAVAAPPAEEKSPTPQDGSSKQVCQQLKRNLHEKSLRCLQLDLNVQQLKEERDEWKRMAGRLKEFLSKVEEDKRATDEVLQHYKDYVERMNGEHPLPEHNECPITFDSQVLTEFIDPPKYCGGPPSKDRCSISRQPSERTYPTTTGTTTEGGSSKYSWKTPKLITETEVLDAQWNDICEGSSELGPGRAMTPPLHLVSVRNGVMKAKGNISKKFRKMGGQGNVSQRSARQEEQIPEEDIPREIQIFMGGDENNSPSSGEGEWNEAAAAGAMSEQMEMETSDLPQNDARQMKVDKRAMAAYKMERSQSTRLERSGSSAMSKVVSGVPQGHSQPHKLERSVSNVLERRSQALPSA